MKMNEILKISTDEMISRLEKTRKRHWMFILLAVSCELAHVIFKLPVWSSVIPVSLCMFAWGYSVLVTPCLLNIYYKLKSLEKSEQ